MFCKELKLGSGIERGVNGFFRLVDHESLLQRDGIYAEIGMIR